MTTEKLQKARDFEQQYMRYADKERPVFHATGAIGWINDPNGFSVYKGEYHLFFQYYPYKTQWGPMHWGHVKTKDFIKWEFLPCAMAPDAKCDPDGCFSGSALEMPDGRQLLMYTGVHHIRRADGIVDEIQHQCIAIGDGIDYEKYENNPVLDASDLPEGASNLDFRDPKVWYDEEEKAYYVVVGNRPADGSGSVLLYRSEDAVHWKFVTILDACYNEYGKMWECPDFFPLDGKYALLTSPQEMTPLGLEFHAGYGVIALVGNYDKKAHRFDRQHVQSIDYGIDFYAPQTLETPDGRRVMVAWMQNWTTTNCQPQGIRIFGSMTLPRELHIREDGRLIQTPVRELANYHGRRVFYENLVINRECNLSGVKGRVLDMTVRVRPSGDSVYSCFKLNLAKDGEHCAVIRYKPDSSTVRIDRTRCGGRFDIVHVRDFLATPRNGEIKFRVVMDRFSVELFVNDGEQVATFRLYAPESADSISFESDGQVVLDVEKYDLNI